jgi:hypothetical protein
MSCPEIDLGSLPDYAPIEVNTFVEFKSASLDFISIYPSVFMRGADNVIIDHSMGSILSFWRPGTFKSANKAVHCEGGYLLAYFKCEGNQPRVTLIGAAGKRKKWSSRWVLPYGYPGLTRLGNFDLEDECNGNPDTMSISHLARYFALLTGYAGVSECAPLHLHETGTPSGFLKYILDFDHLEDNDQFSCGLCPGDDTLVDNTDAGFIAFTNYISTRTRSSVYTLGLVAAKTLIAAGEVILKNSMPSSVAIPFGCDVWEFYDTDPPKSTDLIIPQKNCKGDYRILASKGGACFSISEPGVDSPPPPPALPSDADGGRGTGSSFSWPISDPPPAPGARSIGPVNFLPPDVPDPIRCSLPRCKVYRWTYKYVDAGIDYKWWHQCLASSEAYWGGWTRTAGTSSNWSNILYEPVCGNDGVVTHYALSALVQTQSFTMNPPWYGPVVPVAPSAIVEDKSPPVQHRCSCALWKITYYYVVKFAFLNGFRTMASTVVPGCPGNIAPTISSEGIIMCNGEAIGAVGFALSTFLFYRVSVIKVECIQ